MVTLMMTVLFVPLAPALHAQTSPRDPNLYADGRIPARGASVVCAGAISSWCECSMGCNPLAVRVIVG